ncbi:MAG: hypothetical protein LCH53_06215 [Bacteroidetes bacterium]|nr:hypothetical protein [Bacteroidota bacterium]
MPLIRHATNFHFGLAAVLALTSLAVCYLWKPFGVIVLLLSVAYSIWAIHMSDTKGFVRSGQMRRAFEPERHFNGLQTLILMGLMMAQAFVGVYTTMF